MNNYSNRIVWDLKRISEILIINGTLAECPGLVHGKMGIAVFFFHYARFTENALFAYYAFDLIREMQKQLHEDSIPDYEKGISGIGVGLDYLIKNDFLDTDEDIFEDLDKRIYRAVMHEPWVSFSLYYGLAGYGRYWISRLRQNSSLIYARKCIEYIIEQINEKLVDIPAEEQHDMCRFLFDLNKLPGFDLTKEVFEKQFRLSTSDTIENFSHLGNSTIGNITRMYQRNHYFNDTSFRGINIALSQIPNLDFDQKPLNMGLLHGYAGEGLLRLLMLDPKNMTWMLLL